MLFALVTGLVAATPVAFAEETEVIISPTTGSGSPGCEKTTEGCFIPNIVTMKMGQNIIFSNTDTSPHTLTSGDPTKADTIGSLFDTGFVSAGADSQPITINTLGEIDYFCVVHPWMQGLLIVQEASTESAISSPMELDKIMADIQTSDGIANKVMTIDLTLTDLDGNSLEHLTYNIKATQGSDVVLDEEGHMHKGIMTNSHTTDILSMDVSESNPIDITIESVGFGHDRQYREVTGKITTKQIVPEFGTIAIMILAVAIISIVAVTSKSRIIPRF